MSAPQDGQPIATAPRDGTLILVFAPAYQDDPVQIICPCRWHPECGFCVDELRQPTHWMPIPVGPEVTP